MSFRYALLGLLAQRPRHGYELHAAFEAVAGGATNWDVKPAQVYSTLARLQERGEVEERANGDPGRPSLSDPVPGSGTGAGRAGRDRRIYVITKRGREGLAKWFNSPVPGEHQRHEVFVKLMLALATGEPDPARIIRAQRTRLYQELHGVTSLRTQADPRRNLAHLLLLESVGMHIEADLRWLDMVEARLDEIKRQPLPEPELRKRGRPRKSA
jgi:DNA-binding PadR family transcriptional regulator